MEQLGLDEDEVNARTAILPVSRNQVRFTVTKGDVHILVLRDSAYNRGCQL